MSTHSHRDPAIAPGKVPGPDVRARDQATGASSGQDQQNVQLLALSNQILALTKEVHAFAAAARGDRPSQGSQSGAE